MDNIVLDTNCLIMALSSRNEYNQIWKSFLKGKYVLCVSNEILEEYAEVMARNISPLLSDYVVNTILERSNVRRIVPSYYWHLIEADPDDNKFLDCALSANATFIVTEDHHFSVLKGFSFPHVDIVSIDDFLNILSAD